MNQRKSKWLRAVCLSLAVVMALGCLTSCNKGGESSLPSSAPESSAPESEASGNEALDSDTQLAFPVGTEKPETVEEKTIGSIDKERQLKLFKETMDAELEWLASLQAPNGAIPQTLPDANRQARVITCFSAQTCMALLLEPEKYGENVRKYLDWYLSHLNTAETDVSGVDGIPGPECGIGLPLAAAVASRHNGTIIVESRPGRGTSVRLMLRCDTEGSSSLHSPLSSGLNLIPSHALIELSAVLSSECYEFRQKES